MSRKTAEQGTEVLGIRLRTVRLSIVESMDEYSQKVDQLTSSLSHTHTHNTTHWHFEMQ